MQVEISAQNMEITDALRDYTNGKLDRVKSHLDSITSIHITFKVEKHKQIAEGQVLSPGHAVHASADSETMYKSVDLLVDKLVRQLTKLKEKQSDHHR